jgi:hypothetical protein
MSYEGMIPADAQGVAIVCLVYTLANAAVAGLVVLMHCRHGDPFGCKSPCSAIANDLTCTNVHVYRRLVVCGLHGCQHHGFLHPANTLLHQL